MGTPSFAVGVLKSLVEDGQNIVGVITAPDKPAGRGRKLTPSAVKEYAVSQSLPVLQPTNLKDPEFLDALKALEANLQIVVAFRMLPEMVWSLPKYGTFNLHASLLPAYRGAAPINWAIINGETETGVTTFFIDEKIDTGAIIDAKIVPIEPNETAGSLHDKLMEVGSELVLETVALIKNDKAVSKPQPEATQLKSAPKLHTDNTRIQWNQPIESIDAFVRGLSPYPTAWGLLINGEDELNVKVYKVSMEKTTSEGAIGQLVTNKKIIKVIVPEGYIIIEELKLPGKRKMTASELLNGFTFENGAHFA